MLLILGQIHADLVIEVQTQLHVSICNINKRGVGACPQGMHY
jgi:hypothetical protein